MAGISECSNKVYQHIDPGYNPEPEPRAQSVDNRQTLNVAQLMSSKWIYKSVSRDIQIIDNLSFLLPRPAAACALAEKTFNLWFNVDYLKMDTRKLTEVLRGTIDPNQRQQAEEQLTQVSFRFLSINHMLGNFIMRPNDMSQWILCGSIVYETPQFCRLMTCRAGMIFSTMF